MVGGRLAISCRGREPLLNGRSFKVEYFFVSPRGRPKLGGAGGRFSSLPSLLSHASLAVSMFLQVAKD